MTDTESLPSLLLETDEERGALAAMVAVTHMNGGIYSLEQIDEDSDEYTLVFMPFSETGRKAVADLERAMEIIYPTPADG